MPQVKKKPLKVSTTRALKKLQAKWEKQETNYKITEEYLNALCGMGKIKELDDVVIRITNNDKSNQTITIGVLEFISNLNKKYEMKAKNLIIDKSLKMYPIALSKAMEGFKMSDSYKKIITKKARDNNILLERKKNDNQKVENTSKVLTDKEKIISLSKNKSFEAAESVYKFFVKNVNEEWVKEKSIVKIIFKSAKKIKESDSEMAQKLLEHCIMSFPSNGTYINLNNKWNPILVDEALEGEEETVGVVTKTNKYIRVVPKDKKIYTAIEIIKQVPELKGTIGIEILQSKIDEEPTKFRQSRSIGGILISIASIFKSDSENINIAAKSYDVIENLLGAGELKAREIKLATKLKYYILTTLGKFDEAEEWSDNNDLGLESKEVNIEEMEINADMATRDNAFDVFYEASRAKTLRYYRPRVDSYINNGQFKHKLGQEVSDIVIDNIKDKIAIDLQYLDFEIRELLIPYFIKVESNAKIVIRKNNEVVGHLINKAINNYTDDLKFVIDVSKIKESNYKDSELFQEFILAFRVLRNHMVHGSLNLFGLKIRDSKINRTDDTDYIDYAISLFEESGVPMLDEILIKAKNNVSELGLFSIPIVENVLSYDAVENRRGFGLALIILFMTTPRYTFLRIASEIDHKINIFKNRTVLGSKNKLYDALGLNPNWVKELSKIEE